jgi:signal transduction histidine kinase
MVIAKRLRQWVFCCVIVILPLVAGVPPAQAEPYGRGGYNSCKYQACAHAATAQVTTPSGLDVSINLTNSQTIPYEGYTIIVTPLNGQGTSFSTVAFYIDGVLATTIAPDNTGTARWFWKPTTLGNATITMVVTDAQGGTVTKSFALSVVATSAPAAAPITSPAPPAKATGLASVLQQAYNGAARAINALPSPVVYTFPYFLFVLLGVNVVLLVLQAKRELREYRTLQTLLSRARTIDETKRTLVQLVSHYLRTPLTLMQGGIEMLSKETGTAQASNALQAIAERMRQKIEGLISGAQTAPLPVVSRGTAANASIWRHPGLLVPLILIAAIVIPFNYLATHAGSFSIGQVNLAVQAIIFVILVLTTYQVFRRLHLRQRDAHELQRVAATEAATNTARDELVTRTVQTLNNDLASIDVVVAPLKASQAAGFVHTGQQRLHEILGKFGVAANLQGGHSNAPFVSTTLDALLAATPNLAGKAQAKRITIAPSPRVPLYVQDAHLASIVLANTLDNAIAYSPEDSQVSLGITESADSNIVTITDHGSGIAPEKLPLLFHPFSKAEGAETFTHEGMGFSLYLSKLIMAYLGGSIALDSKPREGTTVTLHFPKKLRSLK